MSRKFSEMSLEELWQLFPIFLTEHQEVWKDWYEEEKAVLREGLPFAVRISHIGSTAVRHIWAKPIIDILVEIPKTYQIQAVKDILTKNGYLCMSQSAERISFNKGYTETGFAERVYHLHVRYAGDNAELYFRDYLSEHTEAARQYEQMKLALWKRFEHDRDGYTDGKTEFVEKYTKRAKCKYGNRYTEYEEEKACEKGVC